jgi:hypothetical protein
MTDVMIDLETLGQRAGCAILSIGAVAFDHKTKQLGAECYVVVNRASCREHGLHEDAGTLAWWAKQADAAKAVLQQAESGVKLPKALAQLTSFLSQFERKGLKVWGNGSDFDNAILTACYAAVGQPLPWDFWHNRCYRTLKALRPELKLQRQGTYHNALDDAKTQAQHAMQLLEALHG